MRKIIYGCTLICVFILGLYALQIQLFIEQRFNSVRICNNTVHDIDYFERKGYRNPYKIIHFSNIDSGECTDFKSSYILDNKPTTMIRTQEDGVIYVYNNRPLDPTGYSKKSIGRYTLYINELINAPREVRAEGSASFQLIKE